jgi:hypothetical protein
MAASPCIQCRVDPQTKLKLRTLAERQGLTASALLKRLVDTTLRGAPVSEPIMGATEPTGRRTRIYVRLRQDDHALLRERAAGRGMPSATYVSILIRAHLRAVPPLPDRELAELKRSVGALGMVGRNLNQLARVAHQTGRVEGLTIGDLKAMLRVCEGLGSHFRDLIRTNTTSWETGHAEAPH